MKLFNRGNGLGYILFFSLSFLFITKIDAMQQLPRLEQVSVTAQDNKQITVPAQVLEKIQNKEIKEVIDDQEIVGHQVFINLPSDLLEQFTLLIEHDNTQEVVDHLFEDEAPLNRANKLWKLANNIETITNHLQVNVPSEKIDEIAIKTVCKANRIGLNLTGQDFVTYNQNTAEQDLIKETRLFKTSDHKWLFVSQETLDYLHSNAIDPNFCNYELLNLLITIINNDYSCSLLEKFTNHLFSFSSIDAHIFIKNLNKDGSLNAFTQQLKLELAQRYRHEKVLLNLLSINGHKGYIHRTQLSADGNILMTQSHDKVMVCNTQTRAVLFTVDRGDANGHQEHIYDAQLSADGTTLMTQSHGRAMLHNLPITAHSIQKPLSKFITVIKFLNKTVSIYQQDFTEELARDLSLEQIYAAIYAQQHNQEFPKISIIFAGKNDQMQAIFIEAPEVIIAPIIDPIEPVIVPVIDPIEPVIAQTPIQEPAQQTFLQRAAAFANQHKTAIAVASSVVATGAVLYAGPTATYNAAKDKIKKWFNK